MANLEFRITFEQNQMKRITQKYKKGNYYLNFISECVYNMSEQCWTILNNIYCSDYANEGTCAYPLGGTFKVKNNTFPIPQGDDLCRANDFNINANRPCGISRSILCLGEVVCRPYLFKIY